MLKQLRKIEEPIVIQSNQFCSSVTIGEVWYILACECDIKAICKRQTSKLSFQFSEQTSQLHLNVRRHITHTLMLSCVWNPVPCGNLYFPIRKWNLPFRNAKKTMIIILIPLSLLIYPLFIYVWATLKLTLSLCFVPQRELGTFMQVLPRSEWKPHFHLSDRVESTTVYQL